jgi:hypothetical protein
MPLFISSKENRLLNEFFLYVLENLHTSQSLGALKFASADPAFVKETVKRFHPLIPATATAPEMPATRAFSRMIAMPRAAMVEETASPRSQCWRRQLTRRSRPT